MKRILYSLLALALTACNLPVAAAPVASGGSGQSEQQISQDILVSPDPNATPTATPFQPLSFTATPKPTATPEPPQMPDVTDPNGPGAFLHDLKKPKDQVNILVLGNDYRPSSGYRTDVIMMLAVNPKKQTVKVVSFPRDLYVWIPGWTEQRINTAMAHGGFQMMADTIQYNFGVRPDYYVMTNFQGFVSIVETLGGIEIDAAQPLNDVCDTIHNTGGRCYVPAGTSTLDGAQALWYVRSRYTSNDFDRTRRAQEVLYGLFKKLMSLNALVKLPELYSNFQSSVETDITLPTILQLSPIAPTLLDNPNLIERYAVDQSVVTGTITAEGAQVLIPDKQLIFDQIISKAFYTE